MYKAGLMPSANEINHVLKNIQIGQKKILEDFFEKYPNCHWTELYYKKTGDTVLHCAAKLGLINIIEYLLNNFIPKCVDCKNKDDKTALHEAAQFSHYEVCKVLLQHGASINALKRADWTPLMLACTKIVEESSLKIVELLLENGAIVNYKNKDGWTALHLISREGEPDILKILLKHGLDVKLKTKNGRSALHIAALHGNIQMMKVLLEGGLDINENDSCGNTPLHEAILSSNIEVCRFLIIHGAQLHVKNKRGYSILHLAASEGHLGFINFILNDLNWDINETTIDGFTALHCASRNKRIEAFDLLVSRGADLSVKDKCNRDAVSYC